RGRSGQCGGEPCAPRRLSGVVHCSPSPPLAPRSGRRWGCALLVRSPRSRAVRWSNALIPTLKETPADAVAPSHVLLLRAGMIRQLGAGAYTYLPLGLRVLHKAVRIVREEMDAAGALELLMPALHPLALYEESGRDRTMDEILMRVTVGEDRPNVLGPTHEEVVTDIV